MPWKNQWKLAEMPLVFYQMFDVIDAGQLAEFKFVGVIAKRSR